MIRLMTQSKRYPSAANFIQSTSFGALMLFCSVAVAKIDHVEPPFWWTGMQNPTLQLLVHMENIAELNVQIEYPGVTIQRVIRVESPNYLFLDLLIKEEVKPGTFDIEFTRRGKAIHTYQYELKVRQKGSSNRQGFTFSDALYLITPDRFINGNPDNDNVEGLVETAERSNPWGRHGGDIKGTINALDHIAGMGFTAIWVNPVLENNQPSFSYHGYSTTDYYRVDPRFGSNEEYAQLGDIADQKGIKLIMDMITNHCGSEHWWMKDLPASDWINFDNEFVYTNHRKPTIQDLYRSEYDYLHLVDGWFVETMPDLNHRNPLLSTYLIQNTMWWIEYVGLDGIRMDTYPYNDTDFLTAWTCAVMNEYPNFNITGEEWSENPLTVGYWQQGNRAGYESCLPSMLDFPLQGALRKSLVEDDTGFDSSYEMLANDFFYADPDNFVIFPDNHDMDRFFTQVKEDLNLFKLGMVYFATMRGIPQIYYGTELLFTNDDPGNHGQIRADYSGGWAGDATNAFTGEGLTHQQREAMDFTSILFNWRKQASVIHAGELMHYAPQNGAYVYFRFQGNDKVMVVLNRNSTDQVLDLDRFDEMLKGTEAGRDIITHKTIALKGSLVVPARSPMILELE